MICVHQSEACIPALPMCLPGHTGFMFNTEWPERSGRSADRWMYKILYFKSSKHLLYRHSYKIAYSPDFQNPDYIKYIVRILKIYSPDFFLILFWSDFFMFWVNHRSLNMHQHSVSATSNSSLCQRWILLNMLKLLAHPIVNLKGILGFISGQPSF